MHNILRKKYFEIVSEGKENISSVSGMLWESVETDNTVQQYLVLWS